jgi:hypothetical protein
MAKDTDKRGDGKSGNRREPPIIDLTAKSVTTADAKPGDAKPADTAAKPADTAAKPADQTAKPADAAAKPAPGEAAMAAGAAKPAESAAKAAEPDLSKTGSASGQATNGDAAKAAADASAAKPAAASVAGETPKTAAPVGAAGTGPSTASGPAPAAAATKPEAATAPDAAKAAIDRAEVDRAAARAAERERQQEERRRDREPHRETQGAAMPLVAGIAGGLVGLAVAYGLAASGNWPSPFDPADAQRIQAPLRTEIEAQKTRAADLERRIAAASPAGVEQVQARVAAAEQQLATATRTLQDLAAAPKADPEGMKRLETLSAERKAQVEALRTEVDTLRKELIDSQQSFAKQATDRMAALDQRAKEIEDHFLAELATTRGRLAEQLDAAKGDLSGATQKVAADAKAQLDRLAADTKAAADRLAADTKAAADKLAADLDAARTGAAGAAAALTARLDQDAKALDEKLAAARGALGEEVSRHDETRKSLDRVVGQLTGYEDLRKTVDVLFSRVAGIDELRRGLDAAKGRLAAVDDAKAATDQNRAALAETRGRLDQVAAKAGEVDTVAKALGETSAKAAALGDQMKAMDTRLAEVDQTARKGLETRSEALLALTLGGLKTAIDEGRPYATELATARALGKGVVDLAPLDAAAAKGIPTPAQLGSEFTRLAPAILDATHPPSGDNVLDRLVSSAVSSVSVRRVGDAPGNSAEAIVARVEAKLAARDLAGALAEWNTLPEAGRAKSSEWAEKLKTRVAADKALGAVTASAIGKLVQPGQ